MCQPAHFYVCCWCAVNRLEFVTIGTCCEWCELCQTAQWLQMRACRNAHVVAWFQVKAVPYTVCEVASAVQFTKGNSTETWQDSVRVWKGQCMRTCSLCI